MRALRGGAMVQSTEEIDTADIQNSLDSSILTVEDELWKGVFIFSWWYYYYYYPW